MTWSSSINQGRRHMTARNPGDRTQSSVSCGPTHRTASLVSGSGDQTQHSLHNPTPSTHTGQSLLLPCPGRLGPSSRAAVWAAEGCGHCAKRGDVSWVRTLGEERVARSPQQRNDMAAPQRCKSEVSLYESQRKPLTLRRTDMHSWGRQWLITFVIKSDWFHITGRKAELI